MKKIFRDTLALAAITVVIGFLLGIVFEITKEPIAKQEEKAKMEACEEVFPDAVSFEGVDISTQEKEYRSLLDEAGFTKDTIDEVMKALDASGAPAGYVITVTSSEAYDGAIQFSMGVALDGTTNGISFLSIGETAGLGMRADTSEFKNQFKGKQISAFTYSKSGATADNEIDALSGATITTNAVTNGVNAGLCIFEHLMEGGADS